MIDSLIRLCNKFNKKYYVNEGGCIYLAYIISKHFNDFKVCEYYDSNNEPFHVSLIIDDIIINKPDNIYDGYLKIYDDWTPYMLMKYNKAYEDTMSIFWKQKYKKKIRNEFNTWLQEHTHIREYGGKK